MDLLLDKSNPFVTLIHYYNNFEKLWYISEFVIDLNS